ncbi:porin, partial [Sutterella wadsworthensis]
MKKTLAALAVLGAFAGSAAAADVQLYGVVDEGFIYTNTKVTDEKSDNQFQLGSGLNLGSRWGLKGTEDLGNGYKVGFKLESGFNADTGTLQENRLFRREAGL